MTTYNDNGNKTFDEVYGLVKNLPIDLSSKVLIGMVNENDMAHVVYQLSKWGMK
jgi:hypothetical protein